MTERDGLPADNPLSEREMEVARLLATGASNAEIARDLVISPHTVKVHLRNIFEKLQVNSRTEASMMLVQHGWIVVPGAVVAATEEMGPPPTPEPAPLSDARPRFAAWQRFYLVGALACCLLFLAAPYVGALMTDATDLLTNADQPATAPPAAQLEPRWQMRTPLRQPLGRHALVIYDGRRVLLGGETGAGAALDDVMFFDQPSSSWLPLESLPMPLANLAATTLGQTLYVAGGSSRPSAAAGDPVISDQLLGYDELFNQWRVVNKLPYPIAGAGLVADDDSLYLIGGWDGHNMRDEIWRYTPGARAGWELVGRLAKGRAFLGASAVRGDIYVAGGYDGERELKLLELFSPLTGETRELTPMAAPRGGLALVYDGVALYALGGGWKQSLVNLERYDLSTNSWSNFPSPIQGEWRNLAAVGFDGQIYITGGWAGDYIDNHLEYQSSFRTLLPVISND
ncbi:MAG TPA: LuxR C-terminal-related transcriptional regulator [Caldilinea sp.]|nr:LuxR C-terminal-related transcriptional regulator [Caldilinea sp.]